MGRLIEARLWEKRQREREPLLRAEDHAASVAALILYGEVDIGEPLELAWERATEILRVLFGHEAEKLGLLGLPPIVSVDSKVCHFDHDVYPPLMLDSLQGTDVGSKLARAFFSAPVWLLKFTGVERDAALLGFELPDLSAAPALGREALAERDRWPSLPRGTIDAGGPCDDPDPHLTTEELLTRRGIL